MNLLLLTEHLKKKLICDDKDNKFVEEMEEFIFSDICQ